MCPKKQAGLNLTEAYEDLHHIAERPHPYNSHANDIVRSYLVDRVTNIARNYSHVHISDDLVSNASYSSRGYGVYFEGTNILVKIDGTDSDAAGVLFSAHYDSVSSAPGATDDGMGVATLIQLVEYLAANRPKRTAVFNINNGEEDFLNGAHVFLEHPWANLTDTFLNLEGASAGGRPVLFRATSLAPALAFLNTHVPHPHANVLAADAFARGVIRSGTDYQVYSVGAHPMEGLDLSFYKGRSKYHTKYDAIPYTYGEQKSLWAMMEAAKGAGLALLNGKETHARNAKAGVYFDLFASALIAFPLNSLFVFNIVFAAVGPVMLVLLVAVEMALQRSRKQPQNGEMSENRPSIWSQFWTWFKGFGWLSGFWRWLKFWVACLVTVGLQALLILGYVKLNPFIAYSLPYIVFLSSFTLAYLSFTLVLNTPIIFSRYRLAIPEQQKNTVLIQSYILSWILLVISTVLIAKIQVGGLYFVTMWNVVLLAACIVGSLEGIAGARGTAITVGEARYIRGERIVEVEEPHEEEAEEATERTPLIRRNTPPPSTKFGDEETGAIGWWLLQMLIVVPVPVILVSHVGVLLITSMSQAMGDGGAPVMMYALISVLTFFLVLPLAPFTFKLSNKLGYVLLFVFIVSTAFTWLEFPFSPDAPLKMYFKQTVDLSRNTVETSLTGVHTYLTKNVLEKLPSTTGKDVSCEAAEGTRNGLTTCTWNSSALLPSPGGRNSSSSTPWLKTNATLMSATSARISVQGTNTRACRLYFSNQRVTVFSVYYDSEDLKKGKRTGMQTGFEFDPDKGLEQARIWSRTWDRNFTVDLEWKPGGQAGLKGKIGCLWSEYESGSIGVDTGVKIPAYEEALTWFPKWTVPTKLDDGLVEALVDFEV